MVEGAYTRGRASRKDEGMNSLWPVVRRSAGVAPLYRRPSPWRRWGVLAMTAAGGLGVVACGGGDKGAKASDWVQTDGASGRINLDDVHEAYGKSFEDGKFQIEKFTQRVNEIYEGDHLVVIESKLVGDRADVSGWEDLDGDKQVKEGVDDQLFTISQEMKDNGGYSSRGYGANSYYHHGPSLVNGFLTAWLISSMFNGGRTVYYTPPIMYDSVHNYRNGYRSSPSYNSQKDRNRTYGSSVSTRFGSDATAKPVSPARSSYQSRQVSSGGFKSSGSTGRSISSGGKSAPISGGSRSGGTSSGGKSGGASSGGVSGGGGLMAL